MTGRVLGDHEFLNWRGVGEGDSSSREIPRELRSSALAESAAAQYDCFFEAVTRPIGVATDLR